MEYPHGYDMLPCGIKDVVPVSYFMGLLDAKGLRTYSDQKHSVLASSLSYNNEMQTGRQGCNIVDDVFKGCVKVENFKYINLQKYINKTQIFR